MTRPATLNTFQGRSRFNFIGRHASVPVMKNRIIQAAVAALLKRVSLLCASPFAVIAPRFRCSASRFRCYRITAKTLAKTMIYKYNFSNKSAEKQPEKNSFAVLSLFRSNNSVKCLVRSLDPSTALGHGACRQEEAIHAKTRRREDVTREESPSFHFVASHGKPCSCRRHLRPPRIFAPSRLRVNQFFSVRSPSRPGV